MCGHTHPGFSSPLHDAAGTVMFVVTLSILPREGEDVTHAALDAADAHLETGEVRRTTPEGPLTRTSESA